MEQPEKISRNGKVDDVGCCGMTEDDTSKKQTFVKSWKPNNNTDVKHQICSLKDPLYSLNGHRNIVG